MAALAQRISQLWHHHIVMQCQQPAANGGAISASASAGNDSGGWLAWRLAAAYGGIEMA
jgi:hypothetical protein